MTLSVFKYSERAPRNLHLFSRLFRDGDVSAQFSNEASFLQSVLNIGPDGLCV